MKYPEAIQKLIDSLAGLPSVGPKTAESYVFYWLRQDNRKLQELAANISNLKTNIKTCHNCFALSEENPCSICSDKNREGKPICIVENTQDLFAIEAIEQHKGRYFVLGGLLSTINGTKPEDLNIDKLAKKIQACEYQEMIIALNFTLEGETTSLYLNRLFGNRIKISRLARGLPAGSSLEYADPLTLANAFKYRNDLKQ